jgi:hypothetical protein
MKNFNQKNIAWQCAALLCVILVGVTQGQVNCVGVTAPIITSTQAWACGSSYAATLSTNGAVSYIWSTGATATTVGSATVVQPGTYTVTATDANNCTATNSIVIIVPPITTAAGYSCQPHNQDIDIDATIPIPGTLSWSGVFPINSIVTTSTPTALTYSLHWPNITTTYTATATYSCAGSPFSTTSSVVAYVFSPAYNGLELTGTANGVPMSSDVGIPPYHVCS